MGEFCLLGYKIINDSFHAFGINFAIGVAVYLIYWQAYKALETSKIQMHDKIIPAKEVRVPSPFRRVKWNKTGEEEKGGFFARFQPFMS